MKKIFFVSLIGLLPTLLMAQPADINENVKSKQALPVMIAGSGASVANTVKTAKALRRAEREKMQFAKTTKAFSRDFAKASNVQWSSGKSQHTVMFTMDNIKTIAWYSKGGALLYTMLSYDADKLPSYERNVIKKEFRGFEITHVKEIHDGDAVVYLVHLQDNDSIKLVTIRDGITELFRDYLKN